MDITTKNVWAATHGTVAEIDSEGPHLSDSGFLPPSAYYDFEGFQYILYKIAEIIRTSSTTIKCILKYIYGNYVPWEYYGESKLFLRKGGRVEEALNYALQSAKIFLEDGVYDEMAEDDEEKRNLSITLFGRIFCFDSNHVYGP